MTEGGDRTVVDTYTLDNDGIATGRVSNTGPSIPLGFTFTRGDQLLYTMNRGGATGLGAASSFEVPSDGVLVPISGPVDNFRPDTCWFVINNNGKFGFVTNFQSGDLSSYHVLPDGTLILLTPIVVAGPPESGSADMALSNNGQHLYVRVISDGTSRRFKVAPATGRLTPILTLGGLAPGAVISIGAK